MKLVYSLDHVCCQMLMVWQPAAHHFHCPHCKRNEGPGEYKMSEYKKDVDMPRGKDHDAVFTDQPLPPESA